MFQAATADQGRQTPMQNWECFSSERSHFGMQSNVIVCPAVRGAGANWAAGAKPRRVSRTRKRACKEKGLLARPSPTAFAV